MIILANYFGKYETVDGLGVPSASENCGNCTASAPLNAGGISPPMLFIAK
jgi:hypothetical protein